MAMLKNLLLLLCLLLALPQAAYAQALVNSEIDVDVTGKDAADARAQAMAKAEVGALMDLLSKLTTPAQAQIIVDSLEAPKVSAMVRGTEVLEEKISDNRYRAKLLVTFDAAEISGLIGKVGTIVPDSNEPQTVGSYLVIPAYEEDNNVLLWEENNPWRIVWKQAGLEVVTGDIVVPFGDQQDRTVVNAKTIASANYATLAPLTIRYGVSDLVVVQAKFSQDPDMVLNVVKRHINRTVNEVNLHTYRADAQETKDMLLARAARDIADILQHKKTEELQSVKTVQGGERNTVMVLASITTLSSWTQLRAKLSSLPMIDRLELLAMAPQQVDMVVHYRGSPESLAHAIEAQNIRLAQKPTYWVISRD